MNTLSLPRSLRPTAISTLTILVGVALLAAALAASALNHRLDALGDQRPRQRTALVAALASAGPASTTVRFTGIARAGDRRAAAFTHAGRVVERPVRTGDRLAAGALVARLDPQPFTAARDAARARRDETAARLAQAERDRDRAEALAASQAIGREQVERLRAEAAALRAASQAAATALAECERQCGETELRAPWPALVSTVEVEPGEVVATGQTVARLERTAGSEVPVAVPPALVPRLAVGQPARLQPLGGAAVDGRVVSVAAAADRSHLCEVLVESDAAIAPGSAVAVALTVAEPPTVAVPLAALLDLAGRPAVVVLAAGGDGALRVHRQAVELRGVVGGSALLAPGALTPGARVAVAGHQQAVEGEAVDAADAR